TLRPPRHAATRPWCAGPFGPLLKAPEVAFDELFERVAHGPELAPGDLDVGPLRLRRLAAAGPVILHHFGNAVADGRRRRLGAPRARGVAAERDAQVEEACCDRPHLARKRIARHGRRVNRLLETLDAGRDFAGERGRAKHGPLDARRLQAEVARG